MKQEPLTELQRICYERYQYGRSIWEKMQPISPAAFARQFKADTKSISRIGDGKRPIPGRFKIDDGDMKMIREKLAEYKKLRAEYLKHTTGAIAKDLGMKSKTVHQYGTGRFGATVRKVQSNYGEQSEEGEPLALSFLTMQLTASPAATVPTYY